MTDDETEETAERRRRLAALHRKLVVQGTAATDDYVTWAFSILDYPYMAKLDFTDGSQCTGQVVARQWFSPRRIVSRRQM